MSTGYAAPRHKVVLNIEKREKIDLVQDCRPRYVDPELLPSVKELTLVEKMSKVGDAFASSLYERRPFFLAVFVAD